MSNSDLIRTAEQLRALLEAMGSRANDGYGVEALLNLAEQEAARLCDMLDQPGEGWVLAAKVAA